MLPLSTLYEIFITTCINFLSGKHSAIILQHTKTLMLFLSQPYQWSFVKFLCAMFVSHTPPKISLLHVLNGSIFSLIDKFLALIFVLNIIMVVYDLSLYSGGLGVDPLLPPMPEPTPELSQPTITDTETKSTQTNWKLTGIVFVVCIVVELIYFLYT